MCRGRHREKIKTEGGVVYGEIKAKNLEKSQKSFKFRAGGNACADRKSTRLNSSHDRQSRMPSSA